jgi:hypothetical protein
MKELLEHVKQQQNKHPYLYMEIEKIYKECLEEIKKGRAVPTAVKICKENISHYIYGK